MGIAVGGDIEAGNLLLVQIYGNRIDVLLAKAVVDHRIHEAAVAELFGIPTWPRQRSGNRGRKNDVLGRAKHNQLLPPANSLSQRRSDCSAAAAVVANFDRT
ncbi:MAG TPA: hypothetical protein VFW73_04970 [Lacipirellulaceae bacterium]|nr:hypothetical protein [Lacipirellulaceae bacterium]